MTKFSDSDIQQIEKHGLNISDIEQQLHDFETGFPFANIVSAATLNKGVQPMLSEKYAKYYDQHKNEYKIVKFVPASGAATRMFKDLFEFLSSGKMNETTQTVLDNIDQFAFYEDLKSVLPASAMPHDIIKYLVTECGLNYGNLPKGLLKFHKYDNETRTAVAEHLVEGAQYATSNGNTHIHFTVSPEHIPDFKKTLQKIIPIYESKFNIKYDITLSTQKSETDTIAVNLDNSPFRNDDGTLLFRPAGHGALIENLNEIESDIIFIKNVDNICPDHLRSNTILHKKALAGRAIEIQHQIFEYLHALDNGTANIAEIQKFIKETLGTTVTPDTNLHNILNRPLRICGIIKNTGEPGGGPFWITEPDGTKSLQIIEPGQISPKNINILKDGEYFSPTDLVCMPYDYRGQKFNLLDYVDPTTGFISEKSKNGRPLRAMERPGLWNGAMAKWNTIFIETPLSTFTPVKTICDLIKPQHK